MGSIGGQMDIIDGGGRNSFSLRFAEIDLISINAGKIEYDCKELSHLLQHILNDYESDNYNYTPNPDYDKFLWLCQQLKDLGLTSCEVVIKNN